MGKLVSQISIKSEGDMFQLLKFPNLISKVTPELIEGVDLLEGQWGTAGSVIRWNYIQDGKKQVSKEMIEAIDEKEKSITFKVIEGDLLKDSFAAFKIIYDVASANANSGQHLITWTLEYEKKSGVVPEPREFMDFLLYFTKQIERNYQPIPN